MPNITKKQKREKVKIQILKLQEELIKVIMTDYYATTPLQAERE